MVVFTIFKGPMTNMIHVKIEGDYTWHTFYSHHSLDYIMNHILKKLEGKNDR